MKYVVIDDYDNDLEVLGFADDQAGVKKLRDERIDDTDGECYLLWGTTNNPETYNARKDYQAGNLSYDFERVK